MIKTSCFNDIFFFFFSFIKTKQTNFVFCQTKLSELERF